MLRVGRGRAREKRDPRGRKSSQREHSDVKRGSNQLTDDVKVDPAS